MENKGQNDQGNKLPEPLGVGTLIGDRYLVLERMGEGGMGEIYIASDCKFQGEPTKASRVLSDNDNKVVIKTLQADYKNNPHHETYERKFKEEIQYLHAIKHPWVAQITDRGELRDGRLYYVIPRYEGNLFSEIKKGRMALSRVARLVRQIGDVLAVMHGKGLIYRDIKPSNIMIQKPQGGDEHIVLIDFGIVTVLDDPNASFYTPVLNTIIAETKGYGAPEQKISRPCKASDLYSLGVLIYEMITGIGPYADAFRTPFRQLQPPLPDFPSQKAERLIFQAIKDDPKERCRKPDSNSEYFLNIKEFCNELAEALITPPTGLEQEGYALFFDVVGYSEMKTEEQAQVVTTLDGLLKETSSFKRAGKEVIYATAGDGTFAVFFGEQAKESPVECALEMARFLKNHSRIKLRTGVNIGSFKPVRRIDGPRNAVGDGLNLAQRIMSWGQAEHILLSKEMADYLKGLGGKWADYQFDDWGIRTVKHDRLVHIVNLFNNEIGNPENPDGPPPPPSEISSFEFEVVFLDVKGRIIDRHRKEADRFLESLSDETHLEMVKIPGGVFQMLVPDALSGHEVSLSPFWMGKYPVTQTQWAIVARLGKVEIDLELDPACFKGPNRPVEQVSWEQAVEFCLRLRKKTGKDYRLPTEAEWEYACRAGTTSPFAFGPTITPAIAHYNARHPYTGDIPRTEKAVEETIDVGRLGFANGFGLFGMHGNIWEWCADWYDKYSGETVENPTGPENGKEKVRRGGSWFYGAKFCQSGYRAQAAPGQATSETGFRLVI